MAHEFMAKDLSPHLQPRKTPSQQRSRARVAQILAATRTLLRERGTLTAQSIARLAGISVGSFYQYFPNKKAVLLALYEHYQARLLMAATGFDADEHAALGWREFFLALFRFVKQAEVRDTEVFELARVIRLFPELEQLDQQHGRVVVELMVTHLRRLGARGSRNKLERLGWFIYELNNGIWAYQMREGASGHLLRESSEWELTALISVIASVFPDDAPALRA